MGRWLQTLQESLCFAYDGIFTLLDLELPKVGLVFLIKCGEPSMGTMSADFIRPISQGVCMLG